MSARVITLGTAGGPPPVKDRMGIASALVVDGAVYLVDAGRGALTQLVQAGLRFEDVKGIFVTHLHADHVVDLFSFFALRIAPLATPVGVYGPAGAGPEVFARPVTDFVNPSDPAAGLADLMHSSVNALAYSANVFLSGGAVDVRTLFEVHEISAPAGLVGNFKGSEAPDMEPVSVTEDENVRVSAVLVPHAFPSYAYRFDTAAGSFVFSGDTARSSNLVGLAQNADVLVHEVIDVEAFRAQNPGLSTERVLAVHTGATDVGGVAAEAGARTLVLNHYVPAEPTIVSRQAWAENARVGYDGRVVVADDLSVIGPDGQLLRD
jgi:ribonuclease BN (tRNA processing enzyme)